MTVPKSIPPRTMKEVREEEKGRKGGVVKLAKQVKIRHEGEGIRAQPRAKPREWIYETKPVFKKLKEPLIDVFNEAEEVRIIMDLSGYRFEDVDIESRPDRYIITAKSGVSEFKEEISFPPDVDAVNVEKNLKNGILEIVLPRKKKG